VIKKIKKTEKAEITGIANRSTVITLRPERLAKPLRRMNIDGKYGYPKPQPSYSKSIWPEFVNCSVI
jgi:hypothetical protein